MLTIIWQCRVVTKLHFVKRHNVCKVQYNEVCLYKRPATGTKEPCKDLQMLEIMNPLCASTGWPSQYLWDQYCYYLPGGSVVKNLPANVGDVGSRPRDRKVSIRKIPWSRKWQPTPVFLPGESHGQWSLVATVHEAADSFTWLGT